jgi:multiple sugar transport system permease protein
MVSSTIISTVATFFSVLIGLLAAFAISRYQLGRNFMTLQILSFRMVPPIAVAVPFAIIGTTIGATFTPVLLTLIYIAYTVPLATWMLKSFIDQTPPEIEEAAMMDGMSRWHAHFLVTLPMRRGGLAATILFVFILNWLNLKADFTHHIFDGAPGNTHALTVENTSEVATAGRNLLST